MSLEELSRRIGRQRNDFVILDVRERDAYGRGHVPGARHLARGQLEIRIDETFPDPDLEILTVCEFGKISTLAAATLRELGFRRVTALDGGMKSWRESGYPVETGRLEEHTSEIQSLMRQSYAVFRLKKKTQEQKDEVY